MKLSLLALIAVELALGPLVQGQLFQYLVNLPVPDGSLTGLPDLREVTGIGGPITGLTVSLNLTPASGSPAYLGDLYAYLEHNGRVAILLNRPGRTLAADYGYDDNQSLNVTFTIGGPDIHAYRPSPTVPLGITLAGDWGADGRLVPPGAVLGTDPRTAGLGQFLGENPNGTWSLFVADVSGGGVHQLQSWGLELQAVPEPASLAMVAGLVLISVAVTRGFRRRP